MSKAEPGSALLNERQIDEEAYRALRLSTAWSERPASEIVAFRLRGEGAYELLDQACPTELVIRDGQMRQSLFLADDGRPIADVLLVHDDEDYLLFVEGMGAEAARAHLERALAVATEAEIEAGGELEAEILDLSGTRGVLSLHGPYAWELLGELLGSDIVALPYLNFFSIEGGLCLRAGTTGEYGYDLWLEEDALSALRATLLKVGEAFSLAKVGEAELSLAAFENAFFDPRRVPEEAEGGPITPLELQLQWRLSQTKAFLGAEALEVRRTNGIRERLTYLVSTSPLVVGDHVFFGDEAIGRVLRAERSPMRGDWVAQALIALPYASSGVDRYRVRRDTEALSVRTVGPPVIDNRSLFVDPRRHSFRFREEERFPPVVPTEPSRAPLSALGSEAEGS